VQTGPHETLRACADLAAVHGSPVAHQCKTRRCCRGGRPGSQRQSDVGAGLGVQRAQVAPAVHRGADAVKRLCYERAGGKPCNELDAQPHHRLCERAIELRLSSCLLGVVIERPIDRVQARAMGYAA
jgi:hypothetical protein